MNTTQIQLKLSLSQQLSDLLQSRADRLGIPVTQFVKHLLIKEIEKEEYPVYQMSERTEQKIEEAMKEYKAGKIKKVANISKFFSEL